MTLDAAPAPADRSDAPRSRLVWRIALAMGLGALALTVALTLIARHYESRLAGHLFQDQTADVTELSAAALGPAVQAGDAETLRRRLDALRSAYADRFAGAAVFGPDGERLAEIGVLAPSPALEAAIDAALSRGAAGPAAEGPTLARPIRAEGEGPAVGALAVRWNRAALDAAVDGSTLSIAGVGLLAALAMAALGAWALRRALSRPLIRLERALGRLLRGEDIAIPGAERRDEIGALARALGAIHDQAESTARTRQAIESSSASLMIADDEDRIEYVSPGLTETLRLAQDAVRERTPAFDPDNMVGTSIHDFHKDRRHQEKMLRELTDLHRAEIRLGERRLRLLVSPIFGRDGRRLGTVTEWQDMTADLALLEQIDATVADAAAGRFDRTVEPTGADESLEKVGAQVNRICEVIGAFLSDIETPVKAMAEGDLSGRSRARFEGRFADVAESVNATVARLAGLVADIKSAEAGMRGSIEEVSSGAGDLSNRTEAQASALEQTSATVEEISATISTNADGAREASGMARDARGKAESGQAVVGDAVASMREIEESSGRINDIISVIDAIAFQTNLLALNAAVEAARAGEAGKGFAVVASEVRTLAQRSSEAARDIRELIAASGAKVADGVRHVNATGDALGGLMEAIKSMSETIEDIAQASQEQATGMQEITSAVSHMDETTQRNAGLAEESARAAAELRTQSDTLSELIGFFRAEAQAEAGRQGRAA